MPAGRATRTFSLAVLLALLPLQSASAASSLEQTRREIRATRARLAGVLQDDAQIRAQLSSITSRLTHHQARLAAARGVLSRIDLGIRSEERRLRRLAAQAEERKQALAGRARALYMMGPGTALETMMSAATVDQFLDRSAALDQVVRYDRGVLEDIATIRDDARKSKAALNARRSEAAKVRDEIAQTVSLVGEMAAAKGEAHQALTRRANSYRAEIAALQREQARIIALIQSRSSVNSAPNPGGFAWPVRGRITSGYGPRWGGFHTGVDIDCRTGQPIGASKGGRVIASEWGGGYGQMVIIDHGGGYTTLYAHLSSRYVGRGASVSQLQRIGACGATGNATGDHLHFEVRVNGNHRNPMNYL